MKLKYIFTAGIIAAMAWSCSDDKDAFQGEGQIMIKPSICSDVKVDNSSRAISDEELANLNQSLLLWISNSQGVIRQYQGMDNVPTEPMTMLVGNYLAEAWAGDSVSASWDKRYYKGSKNFSVVAGETTAVTIECKIANVVVSVEYDNSVEGLLADGSEITVQHRRGQLVFDDEHSRGFFMMPSYDENKTAEENALSWTFTGQNALTGATITQTNYIYDPQPGHEYIFKISCTKKDDEPIGGGWLNIVIDDTVIEKSETVEIALAPTIAGMSFNIDEVQNAAPGEMTHRYIYIVASGEIVNVKVTGDVFEKIFGTGKNDFDAITMTTDTQTQLSSVGINIKDGGYDPNDDSSTMKIQFEDDFMKNYLTEEKEYTINFEVTDSYAHTNTKTLTINISNDPISILDVDTNIIEFSHSQALIEGNILDSSTIDINSISILYCQKGDSQWEEVSATPSGTSFSASATGLTPGTEYQYKATVNRNDGTAFATKTKSFTTEPATQLPNNSFEDWQTSSAPYLIYGEGQEMFWDSGNHGSATMSKNVTVPDNTYKNSGNYSVKLASQFVGVSIFGKFAAGNIFIGKYLDTDGTDGVLGWGRAFTGRPSKLKGYMRYEPGTVDYTNSGAPDIIEGESDKGIIYIALLDDHTDTYSGEAWPVVIKTKSSQLFDSSTSNSHIIAYGELVLNKTHGGSGMAEFEIPLDYRRTDIRPTYILCTASASKGGDYFAGGSGSTMWLDDLELIYE